MPGPETALRYNSPMPSFSDFDTRQYRTVDARTGYGEWVTTYERTVEDEMDIALLDRLTSPSWSDLPGWPPISAVGLGGPASG